MKRMAVFSFFDKDGQVDEYVSYLLKDLRQNLDRLVIVCNGKLSDQGHKTLQQFTDEVIVRSNTGFDAGAYRDILNNHLTPQDLDDYDELILLNDTFYGPFYPFAEMLQTMDAKDVDFWGITIHGYTDLRVKYSPFPDLPEHLQSYFIAFTSKLVHSPDFWDFWRAMPEPGTRDATIGAFELSLTKHFADKGYRYAAYCDTRDLDDPLARYPLNHYAHDTTYLIASKRCPILKRNIFCGADRLGHDNGEDLARTFEFIDKHTDYDVNMIYRNLLRNYNLTDLKWGLHWDYVLPKVTRLSPQPLPASSTLIIMHLYYEDLVDWCMAYARQFPAEVSFLVTTNNPALPQKIEAAARDLHCHFLGVRQTPARGRDMAALVLHCRDLIPRYQYVCFVHDKKTSSHLGSYKVGASFRDLLFENLVASESYIRNVIRLFEENPSLGLVSPPTPYHGLYLNAYHNFWNGNYERTLKLLDTMHLHVPLSDQKPPFVLGTAFWFRSTALAPLFEHPFAVENFPKEPLPPDNSFSHAMERVFPYVAQSRGYYSAWVMTPEYASVEVENLSSLFRTSKSAAVFDGIFYGSKELLHAADIACRRDKSELRTTGFKSARKLVRLCRLWYKVGLPSTDPDSLSASQINRIPTMADAWWFWRETLKIVVLKALHLASK